MFGKRRVQKNLKKRNLNDEESNNNESEILGNGCIDDAVSHVVTPLVSAHELKRRKITGKAPIVVSTQKRDDQEAFATTHESNRSLGIGKDQRATATIDYDVDASHDHRAVLERNEAIGKALISGELEEGVYRGMGAHRPVINRREGAVAAGKYTGTYGPVRGNQHVRMTMRIDLNPEICKDYKETGYCGFGDSCIFLHDRSDYKSGWQLEKEWEQQQKAKQGKDLRRLERHQKRKNGEENENSEGDASDGSDSSESDEDDKIPFACLICHEKWTSNSNPVITQCRHFFCEQCALKHYSTSAKCASCGEPTNGIFNSAAKIVNIS